MFTIKKHSTNETFEVSESFIGYINLYVNMMNDLGSDDDEPLPYPENREIQEFKDLYELFNEIQKFKINNSPYIDYFARNYEEFMNIYPRSEIPVPHHTELLNVFSNYSVEKQCGFMKLCDFFDMPYISKIIGMGIALYLNKANKNRPHEEVRKLYEEVANYLK